MVLTLSVLVLITIMVLAFMISVRIDRQVSDAMLATAQADQAARAGVAAGIARVAGLMREKPFHAIGYEWSDAGLEEGAGGMALPVFVGSGRDEGETGFAFYNRIPERTYLISADDPDALLPDFTEANSIDLNFPFGDEPGGWIGSPVVDGDLEYREHRAFWIDLLANPNLPNQPDPAEDDYNPIVARYAFWVEDETAKLDYRVIGNNQGSGGRFQRSLAGELPTDLDLGAAPLDDLTPLDDSGEAGAGILNDLISNRVDFEPALRDRRILNRLSDGLEDDVYDWTKYYLSQHSRSNDLAGTGRRRANLNHIVSDSMDPEVIAADLNDMIWVMTGRHAFDGAPWLGAGGLENATHQGVFLDQDSETGPLSDFGRRFYFEPAMPEPSPGFDPKSDHGLTYLLRIAANIRDYIDSDRMPTYVNALGEVVAGERPDLSWLTGEEPVALGHEAIPYFQEHAWRGTLESIEPHPGTFVNTRIVTFEWDHYFEFFNPSTKDFTAPTGTILKVYNQPDFDGGPYPDLPLLDFELDLSGVTFPAGRATVITTAPTESPHLEDLILEPDHVVRVVPSPADARRYEDFVCRAQSGSGALGGASSRIGTRMRARGATNLQSDYETEIIMTTPDGVLMAFPIISVLGPHSSGQTPFEMTRSTDDTAGTWNLPEAERAIRFVWSTSLRGNDAPSRSGDPRSLNEPLMLAGGSRTAFGNDQGRFFRNIWGHSIPNTSTWGRGATGFVAPANWPDYHVPLADTAQTAYAVVADESMRSIGELGHVYDPHRKPRPAADGGSGNSILYARGGGRTLKVGQPDDLVVSERFEEASDEAESWFLGAWRLTDLFAAKDPALPVAEAASRGKVNINGVLRDGGAALRAVLRSFEFLPEPAGDSARAGQLLSDDEIDELIGQIETYLLDEGPFMCRGEFSQLPFFSATGSEGTAGGTPSSTTIDRGREEIFRRTVSLVTTRSLAFTVYAVGQSVRQNPDGSLRRLSQQQVATTFLLEPVLDVGDPAAEATAYELERYYEFR